MNRTTRTCCSAFLVLGLAVCVVSCRKKVVLAKPEPEMTVILPEPPEPSAVLNLPVPPPPPAPPELRPAPVAVAPPPASLTEADAQFAVGRYAAAARSYRRYLAAKEVGQDRDKALFRLGVAQALMGSSPRIARLAEGTLESLVAGYPKSLYAADARLILTLMRENRRLRGDGATKDETIKRLQEDLERLKKIDMDRRIPPPR